MIDEEDIRQLKTQLERRVESYVSRVAAKADMSRATVSKFFNFKPIRSFNAHKIFDAGLELLTEEAEQRQNRLEKSRQILENNPAFSQSSLKFPQ